MFLKINESMNKLGEKVQNLELSRLIKYKIFLLRKYLKGKKTSKYIGKHLTFWMFWY